MRYFGHLAHGHARTSTRTHASTHTHTTQPITENKTNMY